MGDGPRELEEVTVGWSSPSENHAGGELHTPALRDLVLESLLAHPEAPVQVLVEASQCGGISERTTGKIGDASPFTSS